jgi:hypothetical protein
MVSLHTIEPCVYIYMRADLKMHGTKVYTLYMPYIYYICYTIIQCARDCIFAQGFNTYAHGFAYDQERGVGSNGWNDLTNFFLRAWSYAPYAQVLRRLGAGAPLTVLQFAPLARLRPVLGFYA